MLVTIFDISDTLVRQDQYLENIVDITAVQNFGDKNVDNVTQLLGAVEKGCPHMDQNFYLYFKQWKAKFINNQTFIKRET